MRLSWVGSLWSLGRKLEDVVEFNRKVTESLDAIDRKLRAIEDRLLVMESEQHQLVTEARGAAIATATSAAGNALLGVVTRVVEAEARIAVLEAVRPGPPDVPRLRGRKRPRAPDE